MGSVTHYLELRELGLFRGHRFARCLKTVENLLEEESARPLHNQPCEFSGEPRSTYLMDYSPNKTRIASTHGDHTVRVTAIQTGRCTHILTGHPRTPWCLAFHPSSDDILASGCLGGEVRIWDLLGGGSEVLQNPVVPVVITSVSFHPTEHLLVFSTMNRIHFWDWHKPEPFAFTKTRSINERVRWVKFDKFGEFLYTGINNLKPHDENIEGAYDMTTSEINPESDNPEAEEVRRANQEVNRMRYRNLIRRFVNWQRSVRESGSDFDYPSSQRPRSPVHEDNLRNAWHYAAEVTRTAAEGTHGNATSSDTRANEGSWQIRGHNSAFDTVGASAAAPRASSGDSLSVRRTIRLETPVPQRRWGRYQPRFFMQDRRREAIPPEDNNSGNIRHNWRQAVPGNHGLQTNSNLSLPSQGNLGFRSENAVDFPNAGNRRLPPNVRLGQPSATERLDTLFQSNSRLPNPFTSQSSSNLSDLLPQNISSSRFSRDSALYPDRPSYNMNMNNIIRQGEMNTNMFSSSTTSGNVRRGLDNSWLDSSASGTSQSEAFSRLSSQLPSQMPLRSHQGDDGAMGTSAILDSNEFEILPVDQGVESRESNESNINSTSDSGNQFSSRFRLLMDRVRQRTNERLNGAAASGSQDERNMSSEHSTPHPFLPSNVLNRDVNAATSSSSSASSSAFSGVATSSIFNSASGEESIQLPSGRQISVVFPNPPRPGEHRGYRIIPTENLLRLHGESDTTFRRTFNFRLPFRSISPTLRPSSEISPSNNVTDRTSQTFGVMSLPQSCDQGTDVMDTSQTNDNDLVTENRCMSLEEHLSFSQPQTLGPTQCTNTSGIKVSKSISIDCSSSSSNIINPSHSQAPEAYIPSFVNSTHNLTTLIPDCVTSCQNAQTVLSTSQNAVMPTCNSSHETSMGQSKGITEVTKYVLTNTGNNTETPLTTASSSLPDFSLLPNSSASPSILMSVTSAACLLLSLNRSGHPHFTSPSAQVFTVSSKQVSSSSGVSATPTLPTCSSISQDPSRSKDADPSLSTPVGRLPSCIQSTGGTISDSSDSTRTVHNSPTPCISDHSATISSNQVRESEQSASSSSSSLVGDATAFTQQESERPKPTSTSSCQVESNMRGDSSVVGLDSQENVLDVPNLPASRSESNVETMREMQQRLQQAVQQLQEVNSSVRRLTSSNSQADSLMETDDVTGYLTQRVSELDRRISNLEQSYNSRLRRFQRSLMHRIQGLRERRLSSQNSSFRRAGPSRSRHRIALSSHWTQEVPGSNYTRAAAALRRRTRNRPSADVSRDISRDLFGAQSGSLTTRLLQPRRPAVPTTQSSSTQVQHALSTSMTASRTATRSTSPQVESVEETEVHTDRQGVAHVHLHPDYSHSLLTDDSVDRPHWLSQNFVNSTIAQTFWNREEFAVANNIIRDTHRIQRWDLRECLVPDISDSEANIVVSHCKLHNDASVTISEDGTLLATIVPGLRGFPDSNILAVFSLKSDSMGQCLYTKKFGPNAISVSLSPKNNFVMVGLASKRVFCFVPRTMMVAQVYRMIKQKAGEQSMDHVTDIFHPNREVPSHVSVNSARFLPGLGEGLAYGTNKGDLHFCRPGPRKIQDNEWTAGTSPSHRRYGNGVPRRRRHLVRTNTSTQTTTVSIRHSVSTQTPGDTQEAEARESS